MLLTESGGQAARELNGTAGQAKVSGLQLRGLERIGAWAKDFPTSAPDPSVSLIAVSKPQARNLLVLRIPYATYQGVVKEIFEEARFPWVSPWFHDEGVWVLQTFGVSGPPISRHSNFEASRHVP